jgi:hypothetical protein
MKEENLEKFEMLFDKLISEKISNGEIKMSKEELNKPMLSTMPNGNDSAYTIFSPLRDNLSTDILKQISAIADDL